MARRPSGSDRKTSRLGPLVMGVERCCRGVRGGNVVSHWTRMEGQVVR